MSTFADLQNEVLGHLYGLGLNQPRAAFLTVAVDETELVLTVTDASDFGQGVAEIGGEVVFIESVDAAASTLTISPDGRGYFGTTATAHAVDARIGFAPQLPRYRVKAAVNDVILGTYPTLFGVAQTQFTANPAVTTYELPAEAERILSVTADQFGPSREQQVVRQYSFSSQAPTDEWATTNTVTLGEAVSPGATVTVTYLKQPSALSLDADEFTASGLRETAKPAVVLGACAYLTSFMDASRLSVDTAEAAAYAETNQVGIASRISGQLYVKYQIELENERQRLRAATPVAVNVRKR